MPRAEQEKVREITSTANSEVAVEALDSESAGSIDNENVESGNDTMTPKSKQLCHRISSLHKLQQLLTERKLVIAIQPML